MLKTAALFNRHSMWVVLCILRDRILLSRVFTVFNPYEYVNLNSNIFFRFGDDLLWTTFPRTY